MILYTCRESWLLFTIIEFMKFLGWSVLSQERVKYICLPCKEREDIPLSVVQYFDMMDDGDPEIPPQFACDTCGGEMYPEYYKGVHGYDYWVEDRLGVRKVEGRSK